MAPPIKQLLHLVTLRAPTDLAFRKRLLADPSAAIYAEFGVTLPGGQQIRFLEKPADVDTLIVLPDPLTPGDELDEEDLDAVAGGDSGADTW